MIGTVLLGRTLILDFICNTSTGAVSDADSLPSCEVFEDNTDTALITPSPTKRTSKTGDYRVSVPVTAGNGFEIGRSYNVVVTATVGGITSKAVIASFVVENIIMKTGSVVSDGSNSATNFLTDLSESVNDYHKNALLLFTSGNLINQVQKVSAYNGTTKFITTGAYTGIPSAGDDFILLVY